MDAIDCTVADAAFIAAAPADIGTLLAECERLTAQNQELREQLEQWELTEGAPR